jgi:hypothetical protein
MGVHELDGVFHRDDVILGILVAVPTMAARVVDLPEPVAPTMITRPRGIIAMSLSPGGRCSSSSLGMVVLMWRITTPVRPCWERC